VSHTEREVTEIRGERRVRRVEERISRALQGDCNSPWVCTTSDLPVITNRTETLLESGDSPNRRVIQFMGIIGMAFTPSKDPYTDHPSRVIDWGLTVMDLSIIYVL
jgi:hypothetical protein